MGCFTTTSVFIEKITENMGQKVKEENNNNKIFL